MCEGCRIARIKSVDDSSRVGADVDSDIAPIKGRWLLSLPDDVWDVARRRAEVIAPLAGLETIGHLAADEAARRLGISRRHAYLLIKHYREGDGLVTDMAPGHSNGGQGNRRLPEPVEAVIEELVHKHYLTRQKLSQAALYREVIQACRSKNLPVPARNTVTRRIVALHPVEVKRKREGRAAVRSLQSAGDTVPVIVAPLVCIADVCWAWSSPWKRRRRFRWVCASPRWLRISDLG